MTGDEPQLGGQEQQTSGNAPEISGKRPKCPHCGAPMKRSLWSLGTAWLCSAGSGWGCNGSMRGSFTAPPLDSEDE